MSDGSSTESGPLNVSYNVAELPSHLRAWDVEAGERGCWIAHHRAINGYAGNTSYTLNGVKFKASRYKLIYEFFNGPTPADLTLDHLCDNGAGGCLNPYHLKPVPFKENVLRSTSNPCAQNARKEYCINGHEFTPENTMKQSEKAGGGRACRACQEQRNREFLERQGREETNRKRREHYARKREEILAQKRAYRAANRDKFRELNREYYAKKKREAS